MRELIIVSGPPGAGKTTLAEPLARALGVPLLSKDTIKETLFDQLGHVDPDPAVSSKRLGATAMELLWRLAAECPTVMIEANFRSGSPYERQRVEALCARPVEIHCRLPVAVAADRYTRRGASPGHHPVHVARSLPLAAFDEFQEPFGLGPVIEVDTTQAVAIDRLVADVRALLTSSAAGRRPGAPGAPAAS